MLITTYELEATVYFLALTFRLGQRRPALGTSASSSSEAVLRSQLGDKGS